MQKPKGYPKLSGSFILFFHQISSLFEKKIDAREFNDYYIEYISEQFNKPLDEVKENGYQSYKDWAINKFKDWTLEKNNNQLKKTICINL